MIRERRTDEITPKTAENSAMKDGKRPSLAFDMDVNTYTKPAAPSSGANPWIKLKLDKGYCIEKIIKLDYHNRDERTWICTNTDCCGGDSCDLFSLTVSADETSIKDLPALPFCKYGDTIKLEKLSSGWFGVNEIPIIGKQGE